MQQWAANYIRFLLCCPGGAKLVPAIEVTCSLGGTMLVGGEKRGKKKSAFHFIYSNKDP